MKMRKFFIYLVMISVPVSALAQKPILISEDSIPIGAGKYPGMTISIPEVSYEKTLNNWIKEQELGTKSKVMTDNGEMTIFGAIKKEVSLNPVNIYSKLMNQDTMLLLMVCIELKKDQYIERSVGDIQFTAARTYLKEFAKSQYIEFIKDEVLAEEKILRGLNNDLDGLQNSSSKTMKGAQKNKNSINNEQDKLIVLNNELNQLSTSIISENNLLISMEAGPGKDAKASQIEEMEKRRKKLQNEINTAENRIGKSKNVIDKADRALPKNESEQEIMKLKIEEQEAVVQQFTSKLNAVKAY